MVTGEAKPTLHEQVKVFLDAGGYSYQEISKEVLVDAKISEFSQVGSTGGGHLAKMARNFIKMVKPVFFFSSKDWWRGGVGGDKQNNKVG